MIITKVLQKVLKRTVKTPPAMDDWIRNYPIETFVDVGAHSGEFIDHWLSYFPKLVVYGFEPLQNCAELLTLKYSENSNIKIFPIALGDGKSTETSINVSNYAPSSSILPMGELHQTEFPHTKGHRVQKISMKQLDDVLDPKEIQGDLLIKVDTQGFEDRVIAGGEKMFRRARLVLIEVSFHSLYDGQKLFTDIFQKLNDLGFVFRGMRNQILSPKDGRPLQAHAWFEKK